MKAKNNQNTPLWQYTSQNESEVQYIANQIQKILPQTGFLGLSGTLGAGKTTLCGQIITLLGEDFAGSPTYGYVQQYNTIFHWDAYRFEPQTAETHFFTMGMAEIASEKGLHLVEWPENLTKSIKNCFAGPFFTLKIEILPENIRKYTLSKEVSA